MKKFSVICIFVVLLVLCIVSSCSNEGTQNNSINKQFPKNVVTDENVGIEYCNIEHEEMKSMTNGFYAGMSFSSKKYDFSTYPFEVKALRKVNQTLDEYDNSDLYYCKYMNENDLIFVFFNGENYDPVFLLDYNRSFDELIKEYNFFDESTYREFYDMVLSVDVI